MGHHARTDTTLSDARLSFRARELHRHIPALAPSGSPCRGEVDTRHLGMPKSDQVLSSLYSGKLVEKIGLRCSILTGWIIYATVYFGFALLTHREALLVLFLLYGLFYGFTEGPERALMGKLAPKSLMGTVFGYYALVGALSALPASLLFGVIWKEVEPAAAFAFGGTIALIAAGLFVLRFRSIPEAAPSGTPAGYQT